MTALNKGRYTYVIGFLKLAEAKTPKVAKIEGAAIQREPVIQGICILGWVWPGGWKVEYS